MALQQVISLEEGWAQVEDGIDQLKRLLEGDLEQGFTSQQYMKLYTLIYNMCVQRPPHNFSAQLYARYGEVFKSYIKDKVIPDLYQRDGETLLTAMRHRWTNHKIMVTWMAKWFRYLDRYYVEYHNVEKLEDAGLIQFRDLVYQNVRGRTRDAILALIEREREGTNIDKPLVKDVLSIFIDLGFTGRVVYESDFEAELVNTSAVYYKQKAQQWMDTMTCPEYMEFAEEKLLEEKQRVENYLERNTGAQLIPVIENILLEQHKTALICQDNGAMALFAADKVSDLQRMYRLFSRLPNNEGITPMSTVFKQFLEQKGVQVVTETSDMLTKNPDDKKGAEEHYVSKLIAMHDKYSTYVTKCFDKNNLFFHSIRCSFEQFMNRPIGTSNAPELMANFSDSLLCKGSGKRLGTEELDETLDKIVKLLAYIGDKDMFGTFFQKKLARRLLSDKSVSEDSERGILTRLKQQCGAQFTQRMEGMVNDMAIARDQKKAFEDWHWQKTSTKLPLSMSVTVLTTGFWPSYKRVDLALPTEIRAGVQLFEDYYKQTTKSRRLSWLYTLGQCSLTAQYNKPYDVQLTTVQAAILLLFNERDSVPYSEMVQLLQVPPEDLSRCLFTLCFSKYKLLKATGTIEQAKKDIKPQTFVVNTDFQDKNVRIKIPVPPADERTRVRDEVDKDRGLKVDAAITRVMKSRKTMTEDNLFVTVSTQVGRSFRLERRFFNRRVEGLAQRDFLRKHPEHADQLEYVA